MNRDGVVSGALRQRRRRVVSLSILDSDTGQHAVLVDAALVLEGVGPDDGLVGLDGHARVLLDHVACWCYMYWIDARPQVRTATGRSFLAEVRRAFESESHDDLLEGRVARPLTCAEHRIGLKLENETTHFHHSWRRRASTA